MGSQMRACHPSSLLLAQMAPIMLNVFWGAEVVGAVLLSSLPPSLPPRGAAYCRLKKFWVRRQLSNFCWRVTLIL